MRKSGALSGDALIAALDVGTTKVSCFIAERSGDGNVRVVGIGHHASAGLKSGAIVDMEAAEQAVRGTVHAAEQMAGTTIHDVVVAFSGGVPQSHLHYFETPVEGAAIGDRDIRRVLEQARFARYPEDRHPVHAIPVGYAVDGANGVRDPNGLHGRMLGVKLHSITAHSSAMRNLATCVARCHLDVSDFVIAPYAAGLGCLTEDEIELGVTVIDMGGGTTSMAVFFEGALVFADNVPLGGSHVTSDIARGLSTPLGQAERLKTLHGSCAQTTYDTREAVTVPQIGDDEEEMQIPRSYLVGIIAPRVEETLEMVRQRLASSGVERLAGRRVVLTGGASQLPGMRELAGQLLDKQVRFGKPTELAGLAEATGGPAFCACAGLVQFAMNDRGESWAVPTRDADTRGSFIGRLGVWFRENF